MLWGVSDFVERRPFPCTVADLADLHCRWRIILKRKALRHSAKSAKMADLADF